MLTNLYGSSHSYLQDLCSGNACNQAPTAYLQELMRQQDDDSSHDRFHTQNIHIKDIKSHGNVDVSLQELYGSSHSYLMDMGAILDRIRARDHKIKAAIVSGFDSFKIDAKEAGERVGKDFKLAAKDVEWAGHKAW